MQRLGGVVILFFPTTEVVENICSYVKHVETLIIFDNTPTELNFTFQQILLQSNLKNITYIPNKLNIGIPKCLNQAATILREQGLDWMLTMDQDSYFKEITAVKYFEAFKNQSWKALNAGLICLNFQRETNSSKHLLDNSYVPVNIAITSGSIVNLSILNKIGGFEEKLFIDEVDHEYCFRLLSNGYTIQCFHKLSLIHNLGSIKLKGYLWGLLEKKHRIIHSPIRIYFMVRNYNFVSEKYGHLFKKEFSTKKKQLYTTIKNNLLFSDKFFETAKFIILGYFDFLNDNYSRKV